MDDDDAHRRTLHRHISAMGHRVGSASNGEEALSRLSELEPDIVLSDIRMPGGMDGFELLAWVSREKPPLSVKKPCAGHFAPGPAALSSIT